MVQRRLRRSNSVCVIDRSPSSPAGIAALRRSSSKPLGKQVLCRLMDVADASLSGGKLLLSAAVGTEPTGRCSPVGLSLPPFELSTQTRRGIPFDELALLTPTSAWRARALAEIGLNVLEESQKPLSWRSFPPREWAPVEKEVLAMPVICSRQSGGHSCVDNRIESETEKAAGVGSKEKEVFAARMSPKEVGSIVLPSLNNTMSKSPLQSPARSIAQAKQRSSPTPAVSSTQKAGTRSGTEFTGKTLSDILPDYKDIVSRIRRGGDAEKSFTPTELARFKTTFARYRMPDSQDIHKEDMPAILKHLGFSFVDQVEIARLSSAVSQYSTMDFTEFGSFMSAFDTYETNEFRKVFAQCDENGNGLLDERELMGCIKQLGYMPLKSTIVETIALVDLDGDGCLDFAELAVLMNVYRVLEGFSRSEVERLGLVLQKTLGGSEPRGLAELNPRSPSMSSCQSIPVAQLPSVLVSFFGPALHSHAKGLAKEMFDRASSNSEFGPAADGPSPLSFNEVLAYARRLRDSEFSNYHTVFKETDANGNGTVEVDELELMCCKLGYTLTQRVISDLLTANGLHSEDGLDHDSFVQFMQVLHEDDGFTKQELEEIETVFHKFDADKSGTIDYLELSDVLNFMGYSTPIEEVMVLLNHVNLRGTESLEMREFLRFMRLHRESEVAIIKAAFEAHRQEDAPLLQPEDAREALIQVATTKLGSLSGGIKEIVEMEEEIIKALELDYLEIPEPVDWEAFFQLAEQVRAKRAVQVRKRAGFTSTQLHHYETLFQRKDSQRTGTIDVTQATRILMALGFSARTKEDIHNIVEQVGEARVRVNEWSETKVPDAMVDCWTLVQLLRVLHKKDDKVILDKVTRASEQTRFKAKEVAEFQQIFIDWFQRDESRYSEQTASRDYTSQSSEQDAGPKKLLSLPSLVRLFKSLGLTIDSQDRAKLDAKVSEYSDHLQRSVDFADFLRLMRWVLDTNFCKISSVSVK